MCDGWRSAGSYPVDEWTFVDFRDDVVLWWYDVIKSWERTVMRKVMIRLLMSGNTVKSGAIYLPPVPASEAMLICTFWFCGRGCGSQLKWDCNLISRKILVYPLRTSWDGHKSRRGVEEECSNDSYFRKDCWHGGTRRQCPVNLIDTVYIVQVRSRFSCSWRRGTSINSSIPFHKKTSTPNRQIMDGLPSTGQLGLSIAGGRHPVLGCSCPGTPPGTCLLCTTRTPQFLMVSFSDSTNHCKSRQIYHVMDR